MSPIVVPDPPTETIEGTVGYMDLTDAEGDRIGFHWLENRRLTNVQGLPGLGMPGARAAIRARPSYHGATNRSRWQKDRLITLEGYCKGDNAAQAQDQLDTLAAPLWDAINTDRLLRWRRGGTGVELQCTVRFAPDDLAVTQEINGRLLRYQAHLHAPDPRAYLQTQDSEVGDTLSVSLGGVIFPEEFPWLFVASSGGQANFNNTGMVPTPPVIRIYGYCTNPTIRLISTGEEIVLAGEVAAGEYLEIDVFNRTVMLNGVTLRNNLVDFSASTWFELPRGLQTIQLLSSTFDTSAHIEVLWRAAYV
jgi:hypothetical protein